MKMLVKIGRWTNESAMNFGIVNVLRFCGCKNFYWCSKNNQSNNDQKNKMNYYNYLYIQKIYEKQTWPTLPLVRVSF